MIVTFAPTSPEQGGPATFDIREDAIMLIDMQGGVPVITVLTDDDLAGGTGLLPLKRSIWATRLKHHAKRFIDYNRSEKRP